MTDPQTAAQSAAQALAANTREVEALVEDSLIEEISIDGMCGVY